MDPTLGRVLGRVLEFTWTVEAAVGLYAQTRLLIRARADRDFFERKANEFRGVATRTETIAYAIQEMLDAAKVAARHGRTALRHGSFKVVALIIGALGIAGRQAPLTPIGLAISVLLIGALGLLTYDGLDQLWTRTEFFGLAPPNGHPR